ncbi:hypothetical protein J2S78_001096 [Salibacterium salarium]|uniref:hypothetical protein n=1 Tax=Salibacterium salarium TaxID=284579 RepID=UPI00277F9470|nr:hypothetical protein [Salibacterium salarium]MDQ0298688.1 hypothetical protein [Salibacterium salarium]
MLSKDSKRKINFIKNYWFDVLRIDIYTYEEFKLNNFNTLIDELLENIALLENTPKITKTSNGLLFFLKEMTSYIEKNHYFNTIYTNETFQIKSEIKKISSSNNKQDIKSDLKYLKGIIKNFKETQTFTIDKMLRELSFLVYDNKSFEINIYRIKSLVNDLISELLRAGYSSEFLQEKVYLANKYDFDKQNMIYLSLKEQFQRKIETLKPKNRFRNTLVIFRVNNLKTMMPYEINDVLFYNPIRSDLLEWKFNQKVLFIEEGLLERKEMEILDKFRNSLSTLSDSDWSEIKYTDAHCRIWLKKINTNLATKIARKKVEEVVNTLRYTYNLDHISISNECCIRYGLQSRSPLFRARDASKYTGGSYRGFELEKDIRKDKLDDESTINTILNSDNIMKDWLMKGMRSLHVGEDQDLYINKFIHYWIALEYLVGIRDTGNNVKSSVLKNGSEILTRNYFRTEIINIYNQLKATFHQKTNKITVGETPIPEEIKNLPGLSDFMFSCNLYTIADNLFKFEKYCTSEYLIFRLREFSSVFEKIDTRGRFISKLEISYKSLLARLYRIRNKILHSALVDEIELKLYTEWLHSIVIALCNDLIYRLGEPDLKDYEKWKKEAKTKKYSLINYN